MIYRRCFFSGWFKGSTFLLEKAEITLTFFKNLFNIIVLGMVCPFSKKYIKVGVYDVFRRLQTLDGN